MHDVVSPAVSDPQPGVDEITSRSVLIDGHPERAGEVVDVQIAKARPEELGNLVFVTTGSHRTTPADHV